MECRQKTNVRRCICTYPGCPRKGICCDCVEYHRKKGHIPGCFFPPEAEKSYDRSIEHFIRMHSQ
jgi:hypothetical protein